MNERLHRLNAQLDDLIELQEDKRRGKVVPALAGVGAVATAGGAGLYARGVRGALYAHENPPKDPIAKLIAARGIKGNIVAGAKLIPKDIEHHVVNPMGIGIG